MKILYYNLHFGAADGSNAHALGLLKALSELCGQENVLAFPSPCGKLNTYRPASNHWKDKLVRKIKPLRFMRRKLMERKTFPKIMKALKEKGFEPDIILARSLIFDATPLLLKRALKCKLVIENNTPFVYEMCVLRKNESAGRVRRYLKKVMSQADGIYVVSQELKEMMRQECSEVPQERIKPIPNGYSGALYRLPDGTRQEIRSRVRKEEHAENRFVVLFLGSLQAWHGIENLIRAAENMEHDERFVFWVLGDGEKGNVLREYTKRHENLKWFGNLPADAMRDKLFAADLGVMPYYALEHFYFSPLKMFDMIGAGLPFVGLDTGQIDEICRKFFGETFLLPDTDADTLQNRISEIAGDGQLYTQMRERLLSGREEFTWDHCAGELLGWMQNIQSY